MLIRFIKYYEDHKLMFSLDMTASLLISVIGMIYPIMTRQMLNDFIPNKNIKMVVIAGCAVLLCYVVCMFLRYFVQYYGHVIGVKMQAKMRTDLFNHLQKLPYTFFDNHETGKIMTRITSDLQDVSELAHHGPENFFICGITIIASFVYLMTINVYLTLIIFICVPVMMITSISFRKNMRDAFTERRQTNAIINASIESSVTGIRVTKAFNNSEKENEKFGKGVELFMAACDKAYRAMAKFHSSTSFIKEVFNVIVLIAGGLFLYNGKIDFADYSTFIVSVNLFISPVTTLINFYEQYQNGVTGFTRFCEIMDVEPEKDLDNPIELKDAQGKIEFDNVTFSYNEDKRDVLKNISFTIQPGKKLALVGQSGGGKTTICHLIPSFYYGYDGQIKIDDIDITALSKKSLRDNIGIVQQDVFLFNGTIKENILYGRLSATDEEVIEASKKANIYDFIMSLPNGFDSNIGERGVKLSGGQKQRISIARVFLKNPQILILDEATSALDNTTEIMIQEALDELCKGRTTIIVAHRLSTVRKADEIMVVDGGTVIEDGNHDELIKQNGIYKKLYDLQFRDEDLVKIQ